MKKYCTYILASRPRGAIYIGITSDLERRVSAHKRGFVSGFTKRYGIKRLVYFEQFSDPGKAIQRETSLKRWRRAWKIQLIETKNPDWRELKPLVCGQSQQVPG